MKTYDSNPLNIPMPGEPQTPDGILRFPLPEYQEEFYYASNAMLLYSTLCEIDREMRQHLKYDGKRTADELAESIRDHVADVIHF